MPCFRGFSSPTIVPEVLPTSPAFSLEKALPRRLLFRNTLPWPGPQTSHRHRPVQGTKKGRQGPRQTQLIRRCRDEIRAIAHGGDPEQRRCYCQDGARVRRASDFWGTPGRPSHFLGGILDLPDRKESFSLRGWSSTSRVGGCTGTRIRSFF
jgi:hypothetical protein